MVFKFPVFFKGNILEEVKDPLNPQTFLEWFSLFLGLCLPFIFLLDPGFGWYHYVAYGCGLYNIVTQVFRLLAVTLFFIQWRLFRFVPYLKQEHDYLRRALKVVRKNSFYNFFWYFSWCAAYAVMPYRWMFYSYLVITVIGITYVIVTINIFKRGLK